MRKRSPWFLLLTLALCFRLGLPHQRAALAQAPGAQQGFAVTIMNICGSLTAPETIQILSVTLTLNGLPIATQAGPRPLPTNQTTTFSFPVSQFPILGTVTPNDVTINWRRGEQTLTTTFFPVPLGQPQEQLCLRVLLTSGLQSEAGGLFTQMQNLISSAASQVDVPVDPNQAKLFQINNVPMMIAPATTAGPNLGVMQLGSPMAIGSTLLPPGNYRMEVDFTAQQIRFRDPLGNIRGTVPAQIQPVAGPAPASSEPLALTAASACQATSALDEPVEPMVFAGCIGPTISFSLAFIPVPPFVLVLTCIGFLCHPFHPLPPYVSVGFCI